MSVPTFVSKDNEYKATFSSKDQCYTVYKGGNFMITFYSFAVMKNYVGEDYKFDFV